MNRRLQEYAGEYGYRYVDVYTSLIDENNNFKKEYSKDGLHPNKKAYEVITSIIKPILEELIQRDESSLFFRQKTNKKDKPTQDKV